MLTNFIDDEKDLVRTFLDNSIFIPERKLSSLTHLSTDNVGPPKMSTGALGIELIVRPECNQKCKYCYITQYGDKLYPVDQRVDNETILKNLRSFLEYVFVTRGYIIEHWELFAGDMFYDNLFFDIMDVFYEYIEPLYYSHRFLFTNNYRGIQFLIPCNCSFVQDEVKKNRFIEYRKRFQSIGCDIILSYSGDGKYATDARERKPLSDEYYDTLFTFLGENVYCGHPMIAPENVSTGIENYDWWLEMYKKYYTAPDFPDFSPMFLEVRNASWTKENLEDYKKLLGHIVDVRLKMCDNNVDRLAYHFFRGDKTPRRLGCNDVIMCNFSNEQNAEPIACSLQGLLHITLNNLNFSPCHRLTYKQFIGGRFVQDDQGKIIDVEAENMSLFLTLAYGKARNQPGCATCYLRDLCIKGCLGAQYEENGDLLQPADNVCEMLKTKYNFLIQKYFEIGMFQSALAQNLISEETYRKYQKILENYEFERRVKEKHPWVSIAKN